MAASHPTSDASTLRPWQFFTLAALVCATAAVFVVRGTSPENIIFVCIAIGTAALVALGALRMLRPLVSTEAFEAEMVGNRTRAAIEREKNLALRAIKELEFDHAMGKIADADYGEMVGRLRGRAVRLLKQLDSTALGYREVIEKELASRLGRAGAAPSADVGAGEASEADEREAEVFNEKERVDPPAAEATGACAGCGTVNDPDARFCKSCGSRLLAMLLIVLASAMPVFAQIQMPDPKQMSGIPRPVTDLTEGHVSVRLIRGQLSNNITGHPVELHAGGKVVTVSTDENGRADFSGVTAGTSVKAVAVVDGERLESQDFPWPAEGGIRVMLVATAKDGGAPTAPLPPQAGDVVLGDQTRIIIELADEALQVYYLLDIRNSARAPVNPARAFILDMPSTAQGAAILEGAPQAIARGSRITVTGPFAPGRTEVQVSYQLPYSGGDTNITQQVPVPVGGIALLMRTVGNMTFTSPQLPKQEVREFEGERYVLAQGSPLAAGSTISLQISGLPHHSPVPRLITLTLVALIFGAGIWGAVRVPPQASDTTRLKQLTARREKIFADLVRLEQQRRTGAVNPARHAERRGVLIAQLERVYRDLDAEGGQDIAA